VPISAKKGDNVVRSSERMPWYAGGTILEYLERVPVARDRSREAFRFPVQIVLRPHLDYRGFAAQIASGVVRPGDEVVVLPSGRRTRVKAIDTWEGERELAHAPMSVTLRLEDEVDVSRGDMLARPGELPAVARRFDAMLVWLSERPYEPGRRLLLKHTTRLVPAQVQRVVHRVDLETLAPVPAREIALNDIARVQIACPRPLFCDPYAENRATGAFILVDALTNDTVAAGMIGEPFPEAWQGKTGPVTDAERRVRLGQIGAVLLAPGDAALAAEVERRLFDAGWAAVVVGAAEVPAGALVEVAARLARAGLAVVLAGGDVAAGEALGARLGDGRVVSGGALADPDRLADLLADRCRLDA
jgi:bifunctional enzyme CysN/CysC/sulfate adenylyltransferase subunit 1